MSESVINSKIIANYLRVLCRDFLPPCREENTWLTRKKVEENKKILHFLKQIKRLIKGGKCDKAILKNDIFTIKKLNLEIIWYLEIAGVITINEFMVHHEKINKHMIEDLSQKLYEYILECQSEDSYMRNQMVISYISTAFAWPKSVFHKTILRLVSLGLKRYYQSDGSCKNFNEKELEISFVVRLFNKAQPNSLSVKSFFTQVLTSLLQGSSQQVKIIFKTQETIKNKVKNKRIFKFFTEISAYLDLEDLRTVIETEGCEKFENLNWYTMLFLVTFVGTHYKDGWNMLKKLAQSLIKESLKKSDVRLLSLGFLIARQGCFEKPNFSFPSYLQWFSSTFSSESKKLISSKATSSFFFNFLSDLVPTDSFYYLKVHINRPPWVPRDCHSYLVDYISLVKTHLNDLNISTELGICENPSGKNSALFDVENVLRHFEKTSEVLNAVFQASMFCRDYYERKFLVELLSTFQGKKSARHKLIMKLHSLGKIPTFLFSNYKSLEKKK